ncbi:hypothetical protein PLICRDRAFT_649456 [Plicaturopsis crispa FD-325 SS-3]|nr:hypothetical protein PLICRDRAFT_649456 [Plicaturopsis crispa FD-325 SS-3]
MVAEGNADPVTLLPMEDINVHYVPRAVKALPFASKDKGKGKASSAGLLNFFTPKSKKPLAPKVTSQPVKATMVVGRASGKRTLADVMDHDIAVKKKKREEAVCQSEMQSRFFAGSTPKADLVPSTPVAGPSRNTDDKENLPLSEDEDIAFEAPDLVAQEDGYLSPSPSRQSEAPDLSSPIRPAHMRQYDHTVDDFGADVISSPISGKGHALRPNRNHTDEPLADILLRNSPDKNDENIFLGPDLRELFGDDPTSDIDSFDEEKDGQPGSTTPTPSPVTPLGASQDVGGAMVVDDDLGFDFDEGEKAAADAVEARKDVVASGWWHKWARNTTPRERGRNTGVLRRQDTAITPAGRHSARDVRTMSSQPRSEHKARPKASSARNSLVFSEAPKTVPKSARRQNRSMDATDSDVLESAQKRLAPFRCRG